MPKGMPLRRDVPPAFLPGACVGGRPPSRNLIEDDAVDWDIFSDGNAHVPADSNFNDISEITDDGSTAEAGDLSPTSDLFDGECFFD